MIKALTDAKAQPLDAKLLNLKRMQTSLIASADWPEEEINFEEDAQ